MDLRIPLHDGSRPATRSRSPLYLLILTALGGLGWASHKFHAFSSSPSGPSGGGSGGPGGDFYPKEGIPSVLATPGPGRHKTSSKVEELVLALHEVGAFKFGNYTLKVGITSPVYIDLRVFFSHPRLLRAFTDRLYDLAKDLKFDRICGVPYAALPMASVLSVDHNWPMLLRRKERKAYGTANLIEGEPKAGETVLVIEDTITTGLSIFETVEPLTSNNVYVKDVLAMVDGEQGGYENLKKGGLRLHAVVKITEIFDILVKHGKYKPEVADQVRAYVRANVIHSKPLAQRSKDLE